MISYFHSNKTISKYIEIPGINPPIPKFMLSQDVKKRPDGSWKEKIRGGQKVFDLIKRDDVFFIILIHTRPFGGKSISLETLGEIELSNQRLEDTPPGNLICRTDIYVYRLRSKRYSCSVYTGKVAIIEKPEGNRLILSTRSAFRLFSTGGRFPISFPVWKNVVDCLKKYYGRR